MNARVTPVLRTPRWLSALCLVLGLAALGIMFWGFQVAPARAYHAYLAGYMFVLSAAIGWKKRHRVATISSRSAEIST